MEERPSVIRCFLCRQKNSNLNQYKNIVATRCSVSQKTLKDVLLYLARSSSTELHIPKTESVCYHCHYQLQEFDRMLIKLLRVQRNLSKLIEKATTGVDSDFEDECIEDMSTMEEFNNDNFFDDLNVSNNEISTTVREVIFGTNRDTNSISSSKSANCSQSEKMYKKPCRELQQCPFCVMKFRNKHKLQKHTTQAHKRFTCSLCNFSHRNEDYVTLHMNLHEGRLETQCRYCEKQFTTKISTIRHMEVHMDSKKYQCDKCGLCFSQTTVLYNHKLQHDAEVDPLRCEICNQVFKTKRTFRHHMITHRADRPRYSCEYCSKTFTEKYTLKVHKRTHGENIPNPKQESTANVDPQCTLNSIPNHNCCCVICEQSFLNRDQLNRHMEKEHDVILKSLSGELSSKPFIDKQTLKVYKRPHGEKIPYTKYESNSNVDQQFSVNSVQDSKFNCIICEQSFMNKDQLNKHMEKEHDVILKSLTLTNYTQYDVVTHEPKKSCHICGHMFSTQSNLEFHLENVHSVAFGLNAPYQTKQ